MKLEGNTGGNRAERGGRRPENAGINRAERSRKQASGVAVSSVLVALTLIFSYVEMLIPFNFGIPGIKLGLSNLVVLVALYVLGPGYAFIINMIRILLSGLLFSGLSAMLYSLSGGILSFAVMLILMKSRLFSPVGVSLGGGVFHNVGQLIMASMVTETVKIFLYLPVLTIAGTVTGTLLGFAGTLILRRMGRLPDLQVSTGAGVKKAGVHPAGGAAESAGRADERMDAGLKARITGGE